MTTRVRLETRRDDRALAYALVIAAAFVLALATGRIEMVAFAVPFAVALATSRGSGRPDVDMAVWLSGERAIEQDRVEATLTVSGESPRLASCTVEATISPSPDLLVESAGEPDKRDGGEATTMAITASGLGAVDQQVALRATRWGRFVVGPLSVRVRDPWSISHWEGTVERGPVLTVLPTAPRLDQILEPASSHTVAGFHLARRSIGSGTDFAELQDYQPGDRLRDLNRAATARTGSLIVNRFHPEQSGEVVVMLDTFVDHGYRLSDAVRRALVIEGRAAWAITKAHLAAQDRVGLATVGRIPIWLTPGAGARARYAILEQLLSVSNVLDGTRTVSEPLDAGKIPPAALVVFVSPLWNDRYLPHIERLQARGRETAVVQLRTEHLLGAPATDGAAMAHRLFSVAAADRATLLRRAGITVVEWNPEAKLSAVVNAASTIQQRRRAARMG